MKNCISPHGRLFFLQQALRRIIIRARLDRCVKDLAHIEATRQNDFYAERICLQKMIELKSMLNDLESGPVLGNGAVQNRL